MVYGTLFWGRFLDWCDITLNYKAAYFFYRLLSLFDMMKINIEKGRRWDWPITIGDHFTEEEIEEMREAARIAIQELIAW